MGIPIGKSFLTVVRLTMRPINNMIVKKFKSASHDSRGFKFFVWFGNASNKFDIKLNRLLIGSKGLGSTPELHPDIAFVKGIEWFTEVFIFYGTLFGIVFYEMKKSAVSAEKTKKTIESLVISANSLN